ncbi:hypothetical protein N9J96_09540, partial [Paracoccaceae bacterium]|nr:hypothetical protein [Paracoccaceae bacterium]
MNPKISKLILKFSNNLPENDQYSICEEISNLQRSFKWDEWEYGLELIDHPEFLKQVSEVNLLKMFVLLTQLEKRKKGFFSHMCRNGIVNKIMVCLRKKIEETSVNKDTTFKIDGTFDFRADTTPNRDPDQHSATLRKYHKLLWSKHLPNGRLLNLSDEVSGKYLYHNSDLGEFNLTSDTIVHSYRDVSRVKNVIVQVPQKEMKIIYNSLHAIGGYTLFPGGKREGIQTINQARGCNRKIVDRFDLTLECIRRYYENVESPLLKTF